MRSESNKPTDQGGWLHPIDGAFKPFVPPLKPVKVEPPPDCDAAWSKWDAATSTERIVEFAGRLGVEPAALFALEAAWEGRSWAFPMRNGQGAMVGIRFRNEWGDKWTLKGSHSGLFIPQGGHVFVTGWWDRTIYVCEGPTDTAAALTMGLAAIGRPSCVGCEQMVVEFVKVNNIRRVVLVADDDDPGVRGADKLQPMLPVSSCMWVPCADDLRHFLTLGGNKAVVTAALNGLVWTQKL